MLVRNLAERNRHEARKTCLRRQRIVERAVEPAVDNAVPDGEELALAVEQKPKLSFLDKIVGELCEVHRSVHDPFSLHARPFESGAH